MNIILTESVATNLMKENLIFNKKIVSGFKSTFRKNPFLRKETMPNVIADKSQDKNEIILDKLVTFCQPTSQLHNDIDSPVSLNTFTPAEKPESDMSTVKIEAFITSLKIYISCKISMINAKLTSFFDHINKTANNLNHREDKHLELLHDSISLKRKSLPVTQTAVLETISTSKRMLTVNKESSDPPETPHNTTLVNHHQHPQ